MRSIDSDVEYPSNRETKSQGVGELAKLPFWHLNHYEQFQNIVELYYLQPRTQTIEGHPLAKNKSNLQNGEIEREQHGGMHVGRAQFWSFITYQVIKNILPQYIERVINDLQQAFALQERHLLILIRYITVFHDSARKHEGPDQWDKQSAQNGCDFLIKQGIPAQLALLFSKAAAFKDRPESYEDFLKSKKVNPQHFISFHFIRKLVFLADCFDIMRCAEFFMLSKPLSAFADMPGFDIAQHLPIVIELVCHIYDSIKQQKDMISPCVIILPDGQRLEHGDGKSCFNLNYKVGIEHADNVCSVVGHLIQQDDYFSQFLQNEKFGNIEFATVRPIYNPYIHGTSSLMLPMLKRAEFQMMPSLKLLHDYGMAPVCGELDNAPFGGGLDSLDPPQYICFGRMLANESIYQYGLKKVTKSYTDYHLPDVSSSVWKVKSYAEHLLSNGFQNINKLLIYFARAKQLGHEPLEAKEYDQLIANFKGTIQLNYLLLLVSQYIYPNFKRHQETMAALRDEVVDSEEEREAYQRYLERIEKFREIDPDLLEEYKVKDFDQWLQKKREDVDDNLWSVIYQQLTFEKLIERINESKIDIGAIVTSSNPSVEDLEKVLALFELPIKSQNDILGKKQSVTLTYKQYFSLEASDEFISSEGKYPYSWRELQGCLANRGYTINKLLADCFTGRVKKDTFVRLARLAKERINVLSRKLNLLEKIAGKDIAQVKFSQAELQSMKKPFPLILISTTNEQLSLCDISTQEYRAFTPLQFGVDITAVATDTEEHQTQVATFFKENNISNVQVILISDLEKSLQSGCAPDAARFESKVSSVGASSFFKTATNCAAINEPSSVPALDVGKASL